VHRLRGFRPSVPWPRPGHRLPVSSPVAEDPPRDVDGWIAPTPRRRTRLRAATRCTFCSSSRHGPRGTPPQACPVAVADGGPPASKGDSRPTLRQGSRMRPITTGSVTYAIPFLSTLHGGHSRRFTSKTALNTCAHDERRFASGEPGYAGAIDDATVPAPAPAPAARSGAFPSALAVACAAGSPMRPQKRCLYAPSSRTRCMPSDCAAPPRGDVVHRDARRAHRRPPGDVHAPLSRGPPPPRAPPGRRDAGTTGRRDDRRALAHAVTTTVARGRRRAGSRT